MVQKSSDGQFFMIYDLRPSAAMLTMKVAGVGMLSMMGAVARGVGAVVTDPNKDATGFVKVRGLFRPVNAAYQEHFGKLTWAEISKGLSRLGVWHNRVAMPYQMVGYPAASQGPAAGMTCTDHELLVHSPVFLSGHVPTAIPVSKL